MRGALTRAAAVRRLLVDVEAAAALAPERTLVDSARIAAGTGRAIASPIAAATSSPTRSSSSSGPIGWPAPSFMQRSTGGVEPRLLEQFHGGEQVREQQPVDDEAGDVGDDDGLLAKRLAEGDRALARALGRLVGESDLDQPHLGYGVEDVQPGEALADRARRAELAHGQ